MIIFNFSFVPLREKNKTMDKNILEKLKNIMEKNMKKKIVFISTGVVLLLVAASIKFIIAPQLTMRIPSGWSWQSKMVGIQAWADPETGKFPAKDELSLYERKIFIKDETGSPDSVILEDQYTIRDSKSNKIVWQYIYTAVVDPKTGKHLKKEFENDYYIFPQNVGKKTYSIRHNYIKGIPVSFVEELEMEGLNVFLFSYTGRGEYTESYIGTEEFPGVKVLSGQEIKCADDQFKLRFWVEPITGAIIKIDESCYSGDYIYDIASGKQLTAVDRWGGYTEGDDNLKRIEEISAKKFRFLFLSLYLPIGFFVMGLVFIVFPFRKQLKGGSGNV